MAALSTSAIKQIALRVIKGNTEVKYVDIGIPWTPPTVSGFVPTALPVVSAAPLGTSAAVSNKFFPFVYAGVSSDQRSSNRIAIQSFLLEMSLTWGIKKYGYTPPPGYPQPAVRVVVVRLATAVPIDFETYPADNDPTYGWADPTMVQLGSTDGFPDMGSYSATYNSKGKPAVEVIFDQRFAGEDLMEHTTSVVDNMSVGAKRTDFVVDLTAILKGRKISYSTELGASAVTASGMFAIYCMYDLKTFDHVVPPSVLLAATGRMTFIDV